jgi:hypothetical protein
MDDNARLKLTQMIQENNVSDQTDLIRELKHSSIIKRESQTMVELMDKYASWSYSDLRDVTSIECNFLFSYYTDIYNRILKKEIDLKILHKFLGVLERIENGEIGQHEGSYYVGQALKELYVDSALRKSEKLDNQYKSETGDEPVEKEPVKNLSWKQYKIQNSLTYV